MDVPAIASGGNESLNIIEFRAYSTSVESALQGQLNDQNGNKICEFALEVELPVFDVLEPARGLHVTEVGWFPDRIYSRTRWP